MVATFSYPAKTIYTAKVEYKTNIYESYNGKEQRVSKIKYPIKTWILDFEKNQTSREAIETFIKTLEGRYSQFNWTPAVKTGEVLVFDDNNLDETVWGDRQYLCRLGDDKFQNKISYYGYGTFKLAFEAIDDNPFATSTFTWTDNTSLDAQYFNQVYSYDLIHKTTIDDNIVANMFVDKAYDSPRRRWSLKFEKNNLNKQWLIDFFISKKGRLRSFTFTWHANKGGDGNTYTVRFDTDILELTDLYYGYGEMEIPIIEVL